MATWFGQWVWGVSGKEGNPPLSIIFFSRGHAKKTRNPKSPNQFFNRPPFFGPISFFMTIYVSDIKVNGGYMEKRSTRLIR